MSNRRFELGENIEELQSRESLLAEIERLRGQLAAAHGSRIERPSTAATVVLSSEERLQLAFSAGLIGFWEWDVRQDLVRANPEFARVFGIDPDRASTGAPLAEFIAAIHPDDRMSVGESIQQAVNTAGEFEEEYRVRLADGSTQWVLARGRCIHDENGRPARFPGVAVDISGRKRAERAASSAQTAIQVAVQAAGVGWWDHNPSKGRYFWDDQLRSLFGLPPGAEVGPATIQRQVPAEDWQRVSVALQATLDPKQGVPFAEEYRIQRADNGAERWIWARGQAFFKDGVCVRYVGFALDVTGRKRSEFALRESEERLGLALEAGGIGIWDAGPNFEDLHWDDRVRALFGLAPGGEVTAEQNLAALHPDDRATVEWAIAEAYNPAGSGEYDAEFRAIGLDDGVERWLSAKGKVSFKDGVATRFLGTLREITAEKRAEARLRELNATLEQRVAERTGELVRTQEALVQSQKMEAVGQLTGGLAHDFNNLLTGIAGSLEMLDTRISQGRLKDLDRYIAAAQGAAKRAAALTHRLLAFSRRQTLDPKPTAINRLVWDMEELIRRTAGPAITVEVVGAAGLWPTLVDPGQLENALLNLAINARDAMPDGGKLTIETANRWLDERAARERDLAAGQYVSLCVSDTGTGMPPEIVARAFDPFFTTKPTGQGTGLGLSMVYGFVKQSGGQARIYSEPGQGAMVCLYLPRHHVQAEDETSSPKPSEAARAESGETVLVVDDEPTIRMLVTEVLEELGYAAIEAADGTSGLRVLQTDARIDLLVTDVGLPGGMNGRQMTDAARTTRPDLKVLFITGYAENAVLSHGHLEPGMHVMTKPFAMEALANRIRELIAG